MGSSPHPNRQGCCCWFPLVIGTILLVHETYASCPETLCDCSHFPTIRCHNRNHLEIPVGLPSDTRSLRLEYNGLTKLATGDFSSLTKLESLYLYNNKISVIEDGAFRGLESLTRLELTSNNISWITNGTFEGVPKLRTLHLRNNHLSVLPQGVFSQVPLLIVLDLADNDLNEIPAEVSRDLLNVEVLDLSQNPVTVSASFGHMVSLQDLKLNNIRNNATSQIMPIQESAFDGLTNLTALQLQQNYLDRIPKAVRSVRNLTSIELNLNSIQTVYHDDFYESSILQTLSLDYNAIAEIPINGLEKLPFLTSLFLEFNQLSTIPARAFWRNTKLETLSLYSNHLTDIDKNAFVGLGTLSHLGLTNNNLTTIVDGVMNNVNPSVELQLSGNPLHCDCHLRGFRGWFKNNYTGLRESLKCVAPERLQDTLIIDIELEQFACKPRLLVSDQTTSVMEGTDVPLPCAIEADPITETYWITSNHTRVYPDEPHLRLSMLSANNMSLLITDVRPTDEGLYTCFVKNSAGEALSLIKLNVEPTFTTTPGPNAGIPGMLYGIAGGVLAFVLVLIIIAIFIVRKRAIFIVRKRTNPIHDVQNFPLPAIPLCNPDGASLYEVIPGDTDANGYSTHFAKFPSTSDDANGLSPPSKQGHHSDPREPIEHTYLESFKTEKDPTREPASFSDGASCCVVDLSNEREQRYSAQPSREDEYMTMKALPTLHE